LNQVLKGGEEKQLSCALLNVESSTERVSWGKRDRKSKAPKYKGGRKIHCLVECGSMGSEGQEGVWQGKEGKGPGQTKAEFRHRKAGCRRAGSIKETDLAICSVQRPDDQVGEDRGEGPRAWRVGELQELAQCQKRE